jgi:hypothetical protein
MSALQDIYQATREGQDKYTSSCSPLLAPLLLLRSRSYRRPMVNGDHDSVAVIHHERIWVRSIDGPWWCEAAVYQNKNESSRWEVDAETEMVVRNPLAGCRDPC